MKMTGKEMESWDGFTGANFLKADDLKDESQEFVGVDLEYDAENERPIVVLESNGNTSKFSLNVTNANFCKNNGCRFPKDLVGKKIKFKRVKAFSPSAKKEVDSLRIASIE